MSVHNVPAFDLLTGQKSPYLGFGIPIAESERRIETFLGLAGLARARIQKTFGSRLEDTGQLPREIDDIIAGMWKDGWKPEGNNVNLFVTDFGAVVADALLHVCEGKLVFRSDTDISHLSIWWPNSGVELFPFHALLKILLHPQENTVQSLFKGALSYSEKSGKR